MTSNGARVRSRGIDASGSSGASPAGSRLMYFCPSTVLISIDAEVRSPTQASGALNEMTTSLPSSSRSVTVPIRMPAMRTSSSGCTPADSLKRAEYVGPCPMRGRSRMFRDAAVSSSRMARLAAPIGRGFRLRNGFIRCIGSPYPGVGSREPASIGGRGSGSKLIVPPTAQR